MSLVNIELPNHQRPLLSKLLAILAESEHRIDAFLGSREGALSSFVPSNSQRVAHALCGIMDAGLSSGTRFLEWGSGFGVATILADAMGYEAAGIEAERVLVESARQLAHDFSSSARFIRGSFIPAGGDVLIPTSIYRDDENLAWLVAETDDAYDQLEGQADEFDLIFAYPWPGEERTIERLFDAYAAEGALLLTYHENDAVYLKRKRNRRRSAW